MPASSRWRKPSTQDDFPWVFSRRYLTILMYYCYMGDRILKLSEPCNVHTEPRRRRPFFDVGFPRAWIGQFYIMVSVTQEESIVHTHTAWTLLLVIFGV